MKVILILLLFHSVGISDVYSQEKTVKFNRPDFTKSITGSIIHALFQDRDGFLWIGTDKGLNRYDGYNIKVYQKVPYEENSLTDNTIFSINEDKHGNLWIGTSFGGLNILEKTSGKFYYFKLNPDDKNSLFGNRIYCILRDSRDQMWIGTERGLNLYDEKTRSFINCNNQESNETEFFAAEVRKIIEDRNGNIWIGTFKGLYYYSQGKGKPKIIKQNENTTNSLINGRIHSLCADNSGNLWIGTNEGLVRYETLSNRFTTYQKNINNPFMLRSNFILSIFEDSENKIWVGTSYGFELFDKKNNRFIHQKADIMDPEALSDYSITCLYEDRSRNVWIGTWSGLNRYSGLNEKFQYFGNTFVNSNFLKSNSIFSLLSDSKKKLWVGTNLGLEVFDIIDKNTLKKKRLSSILESEINVAILSMCEDKFNNIWIGSVNKGLFKITPSGKLAKLFIGNPKDQFSISDGSISCIYEDKSENLWIGTRTNGLNEYIRKEEKFIRYVHDRSKKGTISGNQVRKILEDSRGNLWVGTNNGLNLFDRNNKSFLFYTHDIKNKESISHDVISSLSEDNKGYLWVGTLGGGLNKFDTEKEIFYHYTTKEGLAGNIVYSIIYDNSGKLWISTDKGLSRLDPETDKIRNFDKSDGLQDNDFNTGAAFKSKDGEIFFGGPNGFNSFYPENIKDNTNIPNIVITKVKKFDGKETIFEDVLTGNQINLSYEDIYFTFEFSALDFVNPDKNRYSYKLEGLDDSWIDCGNRRYATFTKIPAGRYIFRVKASNNDGLWNENGITLDINISSPPWLTWWAKLIYFSTAAGIISGILYKRNQIRKKRMNELKKHHEELNSMMKHTIKNIENEREWIAQNLHDGVNQKLLSTKTYIEAILYNASYSEKELNLLQLSNTHLASAIQEIRSISQKNYPVELNKFGLAEVINNLSHEFIERTGIIIRFSIDIISIEDRMSKEIEFNIYRIIQEAFNNIEKHSRATEAFLLLKNEDDTLILKITDNGIGFSQKNESSRSPLKKNFGLDIMEQRARLFYGEFNLSSLPEKGTEITIKIPMKGQYIEPKLSRTI